MAREAKLNEIPRFAVVIEEHTVSYRGHSYTIPRFEHTAFVATPRTARAEAIRFAHIHHDIPPYRTLLRQSWQYSSAKEVALV